MFDNENSFKNQIFIASKSFVSDVTLNLKRATIQGSHHFVKRLMNLLIHVSK